MNDQKTAQFPVITLPPCTVCGDSVTMPTRMGMSVQNGKCCKCGKTFSAITSFEEGHIARLKEIYANANVDPDMILPNTNTRIFLAESDAGHSIYLGPAGKGLSSIETF